VSVDAAEVIANHATLESFPRAEPMWFIIDDALRHFRTSVALFRSVRSRAALHLEILALRHRLQVLTRSRRARLRLTAADRLLCVWFADLDAVAAGSRTRATGHGRRVAPARVPPVLAWGKSANVRHTTERQIEAADPSPA
jgi:hypothetical protein